MFGDVLHADGAELMGQALYPGTQTLCRRITPELPPFVEVDAFEQQLQLCPRQQRLLLSAATQLKASPLETLTPQAVTAAVEIQHLHLGAFAVDEHEQVPAGRVFVQRIPHQRRESIERLPHVRRAGVEPHPHLGFGEKHLPHPQHDTLTEVELEAPGRRLHRHARPGRQLDQCRHRLALCC